MTAPLRTINAAFRVVQPGQHIEAFAGSYPPFEADVPNVTVIGHRDATVIGAAGTRDVVAVSAPHVELTGLTVTGCQPNPNPAGGLEHFGSTTVRVESQAYSVLLDRLIVNGSVYRNNQDLPYGCYGILLDDVNKATVSNSDISHTGYGIAVVNGGTGTVVAHNRVHYNDVLIRNTSDVGDDDFGAIGIGFDAAAHVQAYGNTIYGNFGPSHDYGTDGAGFEIYQSSDISMANNRIYDNPAALETGAGRNRSCDNNSFTGNIVSGRLPNSQNPAAAGLLLRCATGMTVSNNTINSVDWWAFWIYPQSGHPNGVSKLSVTNNVINQPGRQVYSIGIRPSSASMTINHNRYTFSGPYFGTDWNGVHLPMSKWQSGSGCDANSSMSS